MNDLIAELDKIIADEDKDLVKRAEACVDKFRYKRRPYFCPRISKTGRILR
jgi:hypothetical protein